jgi:subtilisin
VTAPRPAWSIAVEAVPHVMSLSPIEDITPEWAWGGSTGVGVKVAVIDSGIDSSHPAIGHIEGHVLLTEGADGILYDDGPHDDVFGHGTACAGIIRSLAPDCELYSVRVLGPTLSGRGAVFAAGLRWAIENGMNVCNLSLGTTKRDLFGLFHELADEAYFRNTVLVTAANNMPIPSFPSLYASVLSVASHEGRDSEVFFCNPTPPVEFYAPGVELRVAWSGGGWLTTTGNSFAAPHITGMAARILGKHPGLTVSQTKIVLRALASNVGPAPD